MSTPVSSAPLPSGTPAGAKKRESTPGPRKKPTSGGDVYPFPYPKEKTHPPGTLKSLSGIAGSTVRADFLRKVYGIITAQMALTVGICAACMYIPAIKATILRPNQSVGLMAWVFSSYEPPSVRAGLQTVTFIATICSLIGVKVLQRSHPWNYIFLFVFTLCQAVQVGFICAIYEENGCGKIVLQAFAITAVLFVSLTAYAMRSGKDFSYMRSFLYTALWGLVITGFAGFFFPGIVGSLLFAVVGALIFCGYIIYDTWRIQQKFSCDDFIPAAIELYLDIINLFLYILDILQKIQKKKRD